MKDKELPNGHQSFSPNLLMQERKKDNLFKSQQFYLVKEKLKVFEVLDRVESHFDRTL